MIATLGTIGALRPVGTRGVRPPVAARRNWYQIRAADDDTAEIYIYDEIAWYGASADDLVREIAAIRASTINVRLNTPGGSVWDGMAIYQALRGHGARIVTHIEGLAASMGSVIALAGEEVRMAKGAFFMIHNPWVLILGDAQELREAADLLDKVTDNIVDIYVERSGASEEDIRAAMDAETWYTAQEAKDAGFVDVIVDGQDVVARANPDILARFRNVPDRLRSMLQTQDTGRPKIETIRDFEHFLRDAGFSREAAKAIAASGWKAATSDPRDEADDGELVAAVERLVKTLEE